MSEVSGDFTCPQCGETHEGHPTDYAYSLPDDVWAIPKEQRSEVAAWSSDLCDMGERRLIRTVLKIPFTDREAYFGWGVWVEVQQNVFERYLEIYDQDATTEPTATGVLANQPPGYAPCKGHPVLIRFGISTQRPTLHFPADSPIGLAVEQRQGIDSSRYHEILKQIGVV